MKTAELTGAKLDYWVAKVLGLPTDYLVQGPRGIYRAARVPAFINCPAEDPEDGDMFAPSTRADHGALILASMAPCVLFSQVMDYGRRVDWFCGVLFDGVRAVYPGDTPLQAAMRAKVGATYGPEVPDE